MDGATVPSLATVLAQVPDPRRARGRRRPWPAVLLLVVAALLSGANSQRAVARLGREAGGRSLRRLGVDRSGGPSRATLNRLLRRVDGGALAAALGAWLQQVRAAGRTGAARWLDGIAVDGKTLRGARRLGARDAHLLSACCQRHALVLGEVAVADATTEPGTVVPLLERPVLTGETVTFDAAFTHAAVAEAVVARGGAYLMVVKDNQPTLRRACAEATARPLVRPARQHGRVRAASLALSLLHRWKRPDVTAARQYFATHRAVLFRRLGLGPR